VLSVDLATRYRQVREETERLAQPLTAEDQTVQSMPDVSPTKWHRAHVTWFFETFVLGSGGLGSAVPAAGDGYEPFDPAFRVLFNSYYEQVGDQHPRAERGFISRPGIDEVARYRAQVDDAVSSLVCSSGLTPRLAELVELGLHHEQQHQELLLMDAKHVLSCNPLDPVYAVDAPRPRFCGRPSAWVGSEGGVVEIGHASRGERAAGDGRDDDDGFAFDNEGPRHAVLLHPHELATGLVTNADWQAFVADGGYRRPELWLADGWAAVRAQRWQGPLYWATDGATEFGLAGRVSLDGAAPVSHVSYYEADAFARWAGARLPLEGEWESMAAAGRLDQVDGEVWQWTASAYLPYPGFRPAAGAVGEYNGKFMVNQHVLRGSSCYTPAGHARVTYRNFFPPSARWAVSGVRLARDAR
jgi:ergothioneine biosynthesis protein EgtB